MSTKAVCGPTSVSVLTAEGRSAIAVIAVAGPHAENAVDQYFQAANGHPLHQQPIGRIVYGQWGETTGEDLVVCRRDVGMVEVHCHGGAASITQIIDHLTIAGCKPTDWQQWLAGQSNDWLVNEAHAALAEATTLRTASILLDQYHGALHQEVIAITETIRKGDEKLAIEKIRRLLRDAELGKHLTQPWRVVIAGRPNVGKSSLINAIVGYQRAIVFDQPGTTRDIVSATTAIEGWPVKLSDTAGLHQTVDALENAGIALAHQQLAEANLVIWVLDAQELKQRAAESIVAIVGRQLEAAGVETPRKSILVVVNKIDLLDSSVAADANLIAISAIVGTGLELLLKRITDALIPHLPTAGTAIPFTQRQVSLLEQALDSCCQGHRVLAESLLAKLLAPSE